MQKRKWRNLISILAVMLMLFSCTYDVIVPERTPPGPPAPPAPPGPPGPVQGISYSQEIQPIFNENCVSCHGNGSVPPNLTPEKSYNSLFSTGMIDTINPAQSILYKKITGTGSMAKYTPPADAKKILTWIEEGAKNN